MNGIFDAVEMKMLEELCKRGALVSKKYSDKKKYLNNMWRIINWEYVNRRIYAGDRA